MHSNTCSFHYAIDDLVDAIEECHTVAQLFIESLSSNTENQNAEVTAFDVLRNFVLQGKQLDATQQSRAKEELAGEWIKEIQKKHPEEAEELLMAVAFEDPKEVARILRNILQEDPSDHPD